MRRSLGTLCLALLCLPAVLSATTNTWNKPNGDTNWVIGANWTPSGPPGANDIARFNGPHGMTNSPMLAGSAAVGGLFVNNGYNDATYINGSGALTLGTNGVDLTYYRFYVYADLLLNGGQTWTLNRSNREADFRLYGALGGSGPLTVTTAPATFLGNAILSYTGGVDRATFTGGLTIRRPRDVTAYLAVRYDLGVVSAARTTAFGGTTSSPGTIAGDNATFEVAASATTGGKTPGHIIEIVNPLSVKAGGLQILTTQNTVDGNNPNIRFTGPIDLGGVLLSGVLQFGDTQRFSGDITLAQQTGERLALSGRQFDYSTIREEFSGAIRDGSGGFRKPLVLRSLNSSLTLSGAAAGMTYACGTVVDHCGSDFNAPTRDAHVDIAGGSRLGTGAVRVLPGAILRLNGSGNIPTGQAVQLESSALARGVLALNYDGVPAVAGSGGVVAIDGTLSRAVDLSTLGAGNLFLGSRDDGIFSGITLSPGSGNLYRLGGGKQSAILTVSKSVLVGSAGVQVGSAAFRGGGTVYLTATNTFTGPIEVIGLPAWWREPDIWELGSVLRGTGAAGGSPFGSTTGAVTLRCAQLGLTQGASASVTRKESLAFEGRSRLYMDSNNYESRLTFGSLERRNRGVLSIGSLRSRIAGFEKIILENPPAQTNGMLPPWFVADQSSTGVDDQHYLTYDAVLGVKHFSAYVTDVNAVDATKVFAGGGTLTADRVCYAARVTNTLSGAYTLTVASGGIIVDDNNADINCNVDFGTAEGILYGNSIPDIAGVVSGSGGLTVSGIDGHIRLTNRNNNFTGDITVSGGTLYADFDTALSHGSLGPTSNNITLNGGGLCQHKVAGNTGYELSANRTLTLGACGGYIAGVGTNGTLTISSKITGSGVLMLDMVGRDVSPGTITITSARNDYTGGTHVLANGSYMTEPTGVFYTSVLTATTGAVLGTGDLLIGAHSLVTLQGDTNVNANANVQITLTARASFESAAPSIGGLSGAGNVRLGKVGAGTALTIGGTAVSSTFYGKIYPATGATPCSVNKIGAGAFTLYGAHEYTGLTTVSGGTLVLNGSLAGGLTVAPGGTLKVVVGADGAVCLGSVAGDVVLNGSLELEVPDGVEIPMGATLTALAVGGTITEDLINAPAGYRIGTTGGALTLTRAATCTVIMVR